MESLLNYKWQLRRLLNSVSSEYSNMSDEDKAIFEECSVHSYTVIEPIIRTDIEILESLKELVKSYKE